MDRTERLNFFAELAEKVEEIGDIFEDYGIEAPAVDCEFDDCELPNDEDISNVRQLLRDTFLTISANIR